MTLPLLLSVPHAGLEIPEAVASICMLSREEIESDGDEGAAEIYDVRHLVQEYVTTPVARAIVDINRPEDDRGKDGVVKTHTIWDRPIYRETPTEDLVQSLLERYYRPYHRRLTELAGTARLGVDCHTMVAVGPPVSPDPGVTRPLVCLGDGAGACPRPWVESLAQCFIEHFGDDVTINQPFSGGYITRHHGKEMPWVQVELSRTDTLSEGDKRAAVIAALSDWCRLEMWTAGGHR